MREQSSSLAERGLNWGLGAIRENALPLSAGIAAGLLAHMFAFTNKLANHDEILYMFAKGGTVPSGRWGLEVLRLVFPDMSLPWLYGAVSVLLVSVAVCVAIRCLEIKNRVSQALLPALVLCFPSQTGIFTYMFTSSCYAVSILAAVLAAYEAKRGGPGRRAASVLLMVLSLSIYQAYISLTASLFILMMVQSLLAAGKEDRAWAVFKTGLLYLGLLAAALLLYYGTVRLSLAIWGYDRIGAYITDAADMSSGILRRLYKAYWHFFASVIYRDNYLVISGSSRVLHVISCAAAALLLARQFKVGHLKNALLILLCLALLPLSVCCMFLVMYEAFAMVMYGFVAVYMLVFLAAEYLPPRGSRVYKDLIFLPLVLVVGINITYANKTHVRDYLRYENNYAFLTELLSRAQGTPGYTGEEKLAIYGSVGSYLTAAGEEEALRPAYSTNVAYGMPGIGFTKDVEENFIRYFLGSDVALATAGETAALAADSRTADMPYYPAAGSIRLIDGYVFVKLTEPAS